MYFERVDGTISTAPPSFLQLTGHPMRWQLLNELTRSDRQVRELAALVDQRQSLVSYHLAQLRAGGLVTMWRSSADKRDAYYSIDLAACRERLAEAGGALHPGLRLVPAEPAPPRHGTERPRARVLFLCTGNSARSQMAEAILQREGGGRVEAASAGSHPRGLHPLAVSVMRERGIDIGDRRSKHFDEFAGQPFDHVISLCDRVREVCPDFPGRTRVAHWSMPDPAAEAADADDGHAVFARTADELTTRIHFLLHVIENLQTSPEGA